MARLVKEPAGRAGTHRTVEECAGLLDLPIIAGAEMFDAVGAGPVAGDHRVDRPAE